MSRAVQLDLIGRKIRQLRRQRKLTQMQLAEQIGVHQSDLSRMEKGEYRVGLDTLLRILGTFNIGIGEFFEEGPESTFLSRYRNLSVTDRKEVDHFIEFKLMQGDLDEDEDGE